MYLPIIIDFLDKTNEHVVAESLLDTFAKYANSIEQYDELGMLYDKMKHYQKALQMLERCLACARNPSEMYITRTNLAKVYNHLNDPQKAIIYCNLNLEINPTDPEPVMEKSFSYYLLGDYSESFKLQQEILQRTDVSDEVKKRISYNMGTFELASGNFKSGLYKMILGGKEIGVWPYVQRPFSKWDGKSTDKPLLVFAESGIGDELINARFIRVLQDRGIRVLWVSSRKEIATLLARNNLPAIYIKEFMPDEEYVYCDSTTLPILLDVELNTLWNTPFLEADPTYVAKWKAILPDNFIAIKTSGNPLYDQDLHRTVDENALIASIKSFGLPIISLHIDNHIIHPDVQTVDINSWEDTLAIQSLALVTVSSCTSTVHSAGSAGYSCIVLPPIARYYPWLSLKEDDTSYWYSTNLKVFPQTEHKSWAKPLEKTHKYIKTLL